MRNSPPLSQSKPRIGKGSVFSDVFDLFQNPGFSFSPDCALFSPSGGDIDEIYGIDVYSGGGLATMSDRIGFEKTRSGFLPLIGSDGYLFFQEVSRFSCCPSPFIVLDTGRCEEPVYGCRRYAHQCFRDLRRESFPNC